MLTVVKKLDRSTIPGKKIRSALFYKALLPFLMMAVIMIGAAIFGEEGKVVLLVFGGCLEAFLFIMLWSQRKVIGVMGEEMLYVFDAHIAVYPSGDEKGRAVIMRGDGSMRYADIKDAADVIMMRLGKVPVLRGDGFAVFGGHMPSWIQNKLEEKRKLASRGAFVTEKTVDYSAVMAPLEPLHASLWQAYEEGRFEGLAGEGVKAAYFEGDASDGMITLMFEKGEDELQIDITATEIVYFNPATEQEGERKLAEFSDADEAYAAMGTMVKEYL